MTQDLAAELGHSRRQVWTLQERRDELEAALKAERAKVARVYELPALWPANFEPYCDECEKKWPCPTIAALNGEEMK
jgi:hypothetical protein